MVAILLRGIVGSTAYGLAGPNSDVDRLGIFAAPTVAFHGLRPPIDSDATVVTHDPDLTMHEARKYCLLALSANPTVTELLWLPDELYEIRTDLGDELIGLRSVLLSADRVRDAYLGYARQQLNRLVNKGAYPSSHRSREAKHGRHLLRLLDQGLQLYTSGELTVRLEDPQKYRDFGVRAAKEPDSVTAVLADYTERFAAARSPLPKRPDEQAANSWLLRVRAAYLSTPEE